MAFKPGNVRPLLAGLTGGAVFILFLFVLRVVPLWSVAGAILGLVAGNLIFNPSKKPELSENIIDGVNRLDYETALKAAWAKQHILTNEAFKIVNPTARHKVDAVADVVRRILEDLKADPSDFRQARQFMDYYLDATVKIVQRYAELYGKASSAPDIQETLKRVEDTLDTIKEAFEKQLRILMENDKLDLDTELTVLRRTIEMEGLGKDPVTKL